MFIDRALSKCLVYDLLEPLNVKKYKIQLFNREQSDVIVVPQNFLPDYLKNKS